MKINNFIDILQQYGIEFFTGVPDSQLKAMCDYLVEQKEEIKHIIAANEGNAVGLASGYYMASKKIPCVYMQNSGLGNVVNPCASLIHPKVYGIPMIFVVGFRGEPGVKDEPQHIYQGEITLQLLKDLEIQYFLIDAETTTEACQTFLKENAGLLEQGKSLAFVVKKDGLTKDVYMKYSNPYHLSREAAIESIITTEDFADVFVSTTGKISREVFEIREKFNQSHEKDFLTVGSMGHCSMIGLGIALEKPDKKVCILDGDGALLMHMGAGAIIGQQSPKNFIHIVLNNQAHESVGGMPTAIASVDMEKLGEAFGYTYAMSVDSQEDLQHAMDKLKHMEGPLLLEVKVALGARSDLGRPTKTPKENIDAFMNFLSLE